VIDDLLVTAPQVQNDSKVCFWNKSFECIKEVSFPATSIETIVTWGHLLALGLLSGNVIVINKEGDIVKTLPCGGRLFGMTVWHGKLVTGGEDNNVVVWKGDTKVHNEIILEIHKEPKKPLALCDPLNLQYKPLT
jgi:hypothetical protein